MKLYIALENVWEKPNKNTEVVNSEVMQQYARGYVTPHVW